MTHNTWTFFHDIAQIFLHRQFNLKLMNVVTIDGFRWNQMATHAVVNFTLDSPRVLNTAVALINFSFRTSFAKKRYLFVFVLRNDQLKIAKL